MKKKNKKLSTIDIRPFNNVKGVAVKDMELKKNIVSKFLCSKKTEYLNQVLDIK